MPTLQTLFATAAAILAALGGGGVIVLALSSYLGKVWANRLMESDRAKHEKDLASLRSVLEANNASALAALEASLDLHKGKLAGAHADKLVLYRSVVDLIVQTISTFEAARAAGRLDSDSEKWSQFQRDRLRAYGYLGMLAPQIVMDAYDEVIDYLMGVGEGSQTYSFGRIREVSLALLNEIRKDLGINVTPVTYRGRRQ